MTELADSMRRPHVKGADEGAICRTHQQAECGKLVNLLALRMTTEGW
jgi:hypothetical protein